MYYLQYFDINRIIQSTPIIIWNANDHSYITFLIVPNIIIIIICVCVCIIFSKFIIWIQYKLSFYTNYYLECQLCFSHFMSFSAKIHILMTCNFNLLHKNFLVTGNSCLPWLEHKKHDVQNWLKYTIWGA